MLANQLKVGWHIDFCDRLKNYWIHKREAMEMNSWNMRTHEVAFLLNPAFVGEYYIQQLKLIMIKHAGRFHFR